MPSTVTPSSSEFVESLDDDISLFLLSYIGTSSVGAMRLDSECGNGGTIGSQRFPEKITGISLGPYQDGPWSPPATSSYSYNPTSPNVEPAFLPNSPSLSYFPDDPFRMIYSP